MEKLTEEQVAERAAFIVMCCDKNITFPNDLKFGISKPMTVQDMCNCSMDTLTKLSSAINKKIIETDPKFPGNEGVKIEGVDAESWARFVILTARKKKFDADAKVLEAELVEADRDIENSLPPTEKMAMLLRKKEEILKKLGRVPEESKKVVVDDSSG